MALPKRVKVGGSYYVGHKLSVSATPGDYSADLKLPANAAGVINGISVVPDQYGAGDRFDLLHLNSATTATLSVVATGVYNVGANAAWQFDLAALEKMQPNEPIRITYTNTATVAMNVYVTIEYIS